VVVGGNGPPPATSASAPVTRGRVRQPGEQPLAAYVADLAQEDRRQVPAVLVLHSRPGTLTTAGPSRRSGKPQPGQGVRERLEESLDSGSGVLLSTPTGPWTVEASGTGSAPGVLLITPTGSGLAEDS
jgi:hypothetical protein